MMFLERTTKTPPMQKNAKIKIPTDLNQYLEYLVLFKSICFIENALPICKYSP